jgi:hypothetical protein
MTLGHRECRRDHVRRRVDHGQSPAIHIARLSLSYLPWQPCPSNPRSPRQRPSLGSEQHPDLVRPLTVTAVI